MNLWLRVAGRSCIAVIDQGSWEDDVLEWFVYIVQEVIAQLAAILDCRNSGLGHHETKECPSICPVGAERAEMCNSCNKNLWNACLMLGVNPDMS